MKRVLKSFVVVMLLALTLSTISSCIIDDGGNENKVTVSWYYGSKLLKEEKVDKGSKLESWEPVEEGKTFTGWYSEASCAIPFDFEVAVEEDTDIFAAFKSDEYVVDETSYYLIGAGAGDLASSNWDHASSSANLTMVKQDVAGANVYKIQIKMYAGDKFQICHDGSWDGQQGIGYMPGAEYAAGVNAYDNNEYTAEDKKYAVVKDAEGNVIFEGSDEYNKGYEVWNIWLAQGQDGVYEFTFTTYPNASAYNTIEYKLVEKIDALTSTHDMAIIGAMTNNWDAASVIALSPNDDKTLWTGYLTVTEADYVDYGQEDKNTTAFKVYNKVDGAYYGDASGNNIFVGAGDYAIQYNANDNSVKVEKLDYYVVGTLIDAEGKAVNYAVKEGVAPKLAKQDDGSYTVSFEAYDATGLTDYDWMVAQGKTDAEGNPAIISIKVVYGSSLGIRDWYSAENGDNWYLSAGTYNIVLKDGAVTVTKA